MLTKELEIAINHVKESHPTLSIVIFDKQGNWQYMDGNFEPFRFTNIDVSILEAASDSIESLPYIYQLDTKLKMKASEFFWHQYSDENYQGLEMSKETAAKIGKDFYPILKPIFDSCIVLPQRLCIGFEGGKGDGDVNVKDVELLPE